MQILNNKFNSAYAPLVLPTGAFTFFLSEVAYGLAAIKLYHVLPSTVFPIFPCVKAAISLVDLTILKNGAHYYELSRSVLTSWKSSNAVQGKGKYAAKDMSVFSKSCQPLKIQIGNISYITKNSILLYTAFVIQSTINLLLALEFD